MTYIGLGIVAWILVFFVGILLTPEDMFMNTFWRYAYPAIFATLIVYGWSFVLWIVRTIRRLTARAQMWLEMLEQEGQEEDAGKPVQLKDLQLIIESGQKTNPTRNIGIMVNPETDFAIRPYIVIQINDENLVGRLLPMRCQLVDVNERIRYDKSFKFRLEQGENRIVPRHIFKIPRRIVEGNWQIKIFVGEKLWKTKDFNLSRVSLETIAEELTGDLELTRSAKKEAEKLPDFDPRKEFKDILE